MSAALGSLMPVQRRGPREPWGMFSVFHEASLRSPMGRQSPQLRGSSVHCPRETPRAAPVPKGGETRASPCQRGEGFLSRLGVLLHPASLSKVLGRVTPPWPGRPPLPSSDSAFVCPLSGHDLCGLGFSSGNGSALGLAQISPCLRRPRGQKQRAPGFHTRLSDLLGFPSVP